MANQTRSWRGFNTLTIENARNRLKLFTILDTTNGTVLATIDLG